MITDKDVKKLEKTFATKNELKETELRLNKRMDRLSKDIDYKLEPLIIFKEEFSEFKSSVFKSLDWLVSAFKKFEEEHLVLSEQNKRTSGKLDNHEKRIFSLEQRVIAS